MQKKNNTNISSRIIKNNFCLNENGKNIKNKEIKSLEDVIKTNKRPNINAKKFFQNWIHFDFYYMQNLFANCKKVFILF